MEFRIIKVDSVSEFFTGNSCTYKNLGDKNWYIVQYRKNPGFFFRHPKWKNVYYNEQEYIEFPTGTILKLRNKYSVDTWESGYLIYGINNAKALLNMFKAEYFNKTGKLNNSVNIVYEEKNGKKKYTKEELMEMLKEFKD